MKKTFKITQKSMFWIIILSIFILNLFPSAVNAKENPLSITLVQKFNTVSPTVDNTFSYMLIPIENDNPMPSFGGTNEHAFQISGTDTKQIGPITFSKAGIYNYQIFQIINEPKSGYIYDMEIYFLEIHVSITLNIKIIVKNQDGEKVEAIEFVNSYAYLPSDPELMIDPPIEKIVEGNPIAAGAFTFILKAQDEQNPMPNGSSKGTKIITLVGPGKSEFGKWQYEKEGVYYYVISEVKGSEAGYTYDTQQYTIVDTVSNMDGELILSRVITDKMNKPVTSCIFVNKFVSTESGGGNGKITGPKTGDQKALELYYTIMITCGIFGFCFLIHLATPSKGNKLH